MNIPKITADTKFPLTIKLTSKGGPLEGLRGASYWKDSYYVYVSHQESVPFSHKPGNTPEYYFVLTVGHAASTKREQRIYSREEMEKHVNGWIERTVKNGLQRFKDQKQQAERAVFDRHRGLLWEIEQAGGVEALKEKRTREFRDQAVANSVRHANWEIQVALWNNSLSDEQKAKMVEEQEQLFNGYRANTLDGYFADIDAAVAAQQNGEV